MKPHKLDSRAPRKDFQCFVSAVYKLASCRLEASFTGVVNNVESWTTSYGSCERLRAARQGPDAARGAQRKTPPIANDALGDQAAANCGRLPTLHRSLFCAALQALLATSIGDLPPCEVRTALGNYRRPPTRAVQSAQATPCSTTSGLYCKLLISYPAMLLYQSIYARELTRNNQGTAMFGTGCGPAVRSERWETKLG